MSSPKAELIQKVQDAYSIIRKASFTSALSYLQHLIIDSKPEPKLFREVARDWQWQLAQKMIPALEYVAGARKEPAEHRFFWLTLPRGHDKSTLIARLCNWMLAFSRTYVHGFAGARDKNQAQQLISFMKREAELNPWLSEYLTFQTYEAKGWMYGGSKLQVLSADAKSSMGQRPDFQVIDEIVWWEKPDLWNTLNSAREKREGSVMIVITNSGIKGTWQWNALQEARKDPAWYVYEAPGQLDTWMSLDAIEKLRRQLPPEFARRVIDNEWLDPEESMGFVSFSDCLACEDDSLPRLVNEPKEGYSYFASIDYGAIRDRTVCLIGHQEGDEVILDRMDIFQGKRVKKPGTKSRYINKPVTIDTVERWLDDSIRRFGLRAVVIDPYQMKGTIQKFQNKVPIEPFEPRGGKSNYVLAQNLRSSILNKRIRYHPELGMIGKHSLSQEMSELIVQDKNYGYRINHVYGKHDDRSVALGMLLCLVFKEKPKKELYISDYFF